MFALLSGVTIKYLSTEVGRVQKRRKEAHAFARLALCHGFAALQMCVLLCVVIRLISWLLKLKGLHIKDFSKCYKFLVPIF